MKRIFFATAVLALLAACENKPEPGQEPEPTPQPPVQQTDLLPSKSTLVRMGMVGEVVETSYADCIMDGTAIYKAAFDERGMITSFQHRTFGGEVEQVELGYDAEGNLTSIDKGYASLALRYGDHGQWVATRSLFEQLGYMGFIVDYQVWLPAFVRNLAGVTVAGAEGGGSTFDFAFDGTASAAISLDGAPFGSMTFADGFAHEVTMGSGERYKSEVYDTDASTGKIRRIDVTDAYGDMTYLYNDDACNTMSAVESADMPAAAEYDSAGNVVSLTMSGVATSFEYTKDAAGNWTVRSGSDGSEVRRSVRYKGEAKPEPQPVPEDVWHCPSTFYARLLGKPAAVSAHFDGVSDIRFDENGYLLAYNVSASFGGELQTIEIRYTYDETTRLVKRIDSDMLSFEFVYGDHTKYVEVEYDVFESNGIDYAYLFQPAMLQGLTAIEAVEASGNKVRYAFDAAEESVTVTCNGEEWSECDYNGDMPAVRHTKWMQGTVAVTCDETFEFYDNRSLRSRNTATTYTDSKGQSYSDETLSTYNDDHYNTLATEGDDVYEYDDKGNRIRISGGWITSTFTYVFDSVGNWTKATETAVVGGSTEKPATDVREITYY